MSIEIKMPALSPTMEEGTLAKWLVKEGDQVKSGDIMAEIETDKATMEFEAVDEGTIARILVAEGTDGVKVGTAIAILAEDGEDAGSVEAPTKSETPEPTDPEFKGRPDPTDPNAKGDEGDAAPRTEASAEDHGRPDDAGRHLKGDSSPEAAWLGSRASIQLGEWDRAQSDLERAGGPAAAAGAREPVAQHLVVLLTADDCPHGGRVVGRQARYIPGALLLHRCHR